MRYEPDALFILALGDKAELFFQCWRDMPRENHTQNNAECLAEILAGFEGEERMRDIVADSDLIWLPPSF